MRGRSVMDYHGAIRMQDILEETKGGSLPLSTLRSLKIING